MKSYTEQEFRKVLKVIMSRQQYEGTFILTDPEGNPRYKFKIEPYSRSIKAAEVFGLWRKPNTVLKDLNEPTLDEWSLV